MKLIFFVIATLVFSPHTASAKQLPTVAQDLVIKNELDNPGFENGSYGWTASGGATKTANSTAKGSGVYGYDWDSNSASQTLLSNAVTIPSALYGKQGVAFCKIKVPSGTATHTITVNDGTNDLVTAQTITSDASSFARQMVFFQFPSSGSVKIKLASVNSNEPEIYIDDCYLGDAFNITDVSQATYFGGMSNAGASSCKYLENTSSGVTDFDALGTGTSCAAWSVDSAGSSNGLAAQGTNDHRLVATNMPAGEYQFVLTGTFESIVSGSACLFALSDGTNTYQPQAVGQTSTPTILSGSLIFHVSKTSSSTTTWTVVASDAATSCAWNNGANTPASWKIYRFPTSDRQALNIETINWRVDANISGANVALSSSDQASYIGLENASLTLTNNSGRGVLTAQIPCSSTNAPSGTTCSAGNESVGVSFVLPAAQDVLACASFTHNAGTGSSGDATATFQIVETPNNAQTISQEGKSRIASGHNMSSADSSHANRVCGTFTFTSAGQKTLRLMYEQNVTATIFYNQIMADADAATGQRDIHWEVYPINQQMPAPILVGGVTSRSSSLLMPDGFLADSSGVVTEIAGADLVSQTTATPSSSVYTYTFSVPYSSQPLCIVQNVQAASGVISNTGTPQLTDLSTTGFKVRTFDASSTGANRPHAVYCWGPR